MTIDVKSLGVIDRFNRIDIEQTRDYVKLYWCELAHTVTLSQACALLLCVCAIFGRLGSSEMAVSPYPDHCGQK